MHLSNILSSNGHLSNGHHIFNLIVNPYAADYGGASSALYKLRMIVTFLYFHHAQVF